jgi:hypothetical protein
MKWLQLREPTKLSCHAVYGCAEHCFQERNLEHKHRDSSSRHERWTGVLDRNGSGCGECNGMAARLKLLSHAVDPASSTMRRILLRSSSLYPL